MTDTRTRSARLRVLATSDLHAHLWPHDYDRDRPTEGLGLARLASLIRAERAAAPATLLVDNGDLLQGTQLADRAAEEAAPHPMLRAMAALGYDAGTLGNHDFNYGLARLEAWLAEASHPLVLANIVRRLGASPPDDIPLLPPVALVERAVPLDGGGSALLRIGLVGAAPPQTLQWDRHLLDGRLAARGIRESVAAWLPRLRAMGADLVVALLHCGVGDGSAAPEAEDAALAVAGLPGIDAIVAGHSHRRLPGVDFADAPGVDAGAGRLAGVPAVMPGAMGSDLGVIDLDLALSAAGEWRVAGAACRLRAAAGAAPDPEILALSRRDHLRMRRAARRPVGQLARPAHALFALVAPSPALHLAAQAQAWRARQLLSQAELPILSAVAPFRLGGPGQPENYTNLPAGPLRRGQISELAPFPNSLCVVEATGETLRLWLERGVSGYATLAPGQRDAPLARPGAAGYNFEQICGLTYVIDLSRTGWFDAAGTPLERAEATGRIREIRHAGRPVAPEDRFAVVTNTYRAAGGGGFPGLAACPRLATAPEPLACTLAAFVAGRAGLPPEPPAVWSFAPLDATALFASAPGADWQRDGAGPHRVTPAGAGPDGSRLFRLHLDAPTARAAGS